MVLNLDLVVVYVCFDPAACNAEVACQLPAFSGKSRSKTRENVNFAAEFRENPALTELPVTLVARSMLLAWETLTDAVQTGRRGQRVVLAGYASRADNNAVRPRLK